jgi:hypothetical protein
MNAGLCRFGLIIRNKYCLSEETQSHNIIYHLSFIIYHLSFIIYHLSFIIYHLSDKIII